MHAQHDLAARFRQLHRPGDPLLLPNAWDAGTARLLATSGFAAIATTSAGHAATLGRADGQVTRDEALAHAAALVASTTVPVSADLEAGFGTTADEVAETVLLAIGAGLAGCSVEDATGDPAAPIRPLDDAVARIAAAAEAAHGAGRDLVLTARAENHLHGIDDLDDTVERLRAFAAAGADVLYAPGLVEPAAIRRVVDEVDGPVNVLLLPGGPDVPALARLGVARISLGSALHLAAMGALVAAARELRGGGPYAFWDVVTTGRSARDESLAGS